MLPKKLQDRIEFDALNNSVPHGNRDKPAWEYSIIDETRIAQELYADLECVLDSLERYEKCHLTDSWKVSRKGHRCLRCNTINAIKAKYKGDE